MDVECRIVVNIKINEKKYIYTIIIFNNLELRICQKKREIYTPLAERALYFTWEHSRCTGQHRACVYKGGWLLRVLHCTATVSLLPVAVTDGLAHCRRQFIG